MDLIIEAVNVGTHPSIAFLGDAMRHFGPHASACPQAQAVRYAVTKAMQQRFSDSSVCVAHAPLLKNVMDAGTDSELLMLALAPLAPHSRAVQLGCEVLLWHHQRLCKKHEQGLCSINPFSLSVLLVAVCGGDHQSLVRLATSIGWATEPDFSLPGAQVTIALLLAAVDANCVPLLRWLHSCIGGFKNDPHKNISVVEAASMGHVEVLRYLHEECGADCATNDGHALQAAAYHGQLEAIRYLHEVAGVDCLTLGKYVLIEAAGEGHVEIVRYLHTVVGMDLSATAMVCAAESDKNISVLKYLHEECGLDCGLLDGEPLMEAAQNGCLEVIRYLHERGGVDCRIRNGEALVIAATYGHMEVVRYLHFSAGVDCWAQNGLPILRATEQGYMGVAAFLASRPPMQ